jgi:hypothetical protein
LPPRGTPDVPKFTLRVIFDIKTTIDGNYCDKLRPVCRLFLDLSYSTVTPTPIMWRAAQMAVRGKYSCKDRPRLWMDGHSRSEIHPNNGHTFKRVRYNCLLCEQGLSDWATFAGAILLDNYQTSPACPPVQRRSNACRILQSPLTVDTDTQTVQVLL